MKRKLNLKFLACLLGTTLLFGTGVHFLHGFQVQRNAGTLLEQAWQAKEKGQPQTVVKLLGLYLAYRPGDTEARAEFGLNLATLAHDPRSKQNAFFALHDVIQRGGDRADVRRRLVGLAMDAALQRFSDARYQLEILLKATSDDAELEQLYGECLEAEQQYKQAVEWYVKAVKHAPANVDVAARLADVLQRRLNRPKEAAAVMDHLVKSNPSGRAHLARSRFHKAAGAADKAAADMAKAYQLAPDEADIMLAMAGLAVERKNSGNADWEQARGYLRRGLELHARDVRFHRALAGVELRAGRRPEAVSCLRGGLVAVPDQPELLWDLANLLVEDGAAIEDEIARLRRAGVSHVRLDYLQARLLINKKEWLAAIRVLEPIHAEAESWPELAKQINFQLGQCYGQLGDVEQQYNAYRRALAADPLWQPACVGLGAAQLALGRVDDAIETYRLVLVSEPRTRLVLARLLIHKNLRLPSDRRQWLEVARVLDEAEPAVRDSAEAFILRAEVLAARGEPDRAYDLVLRAREKHPELVELRIALASLAERLGKAGGMLAVLGEAERQLGDRIELRLARSDYWARQNGDNARQELLKLEQVLDRFSPENQSALLRALAGAHARRGDAQQGARLWDRLAGQRPNDMGIKLARFDLALQAGDDDAMRRTIDDIRKLEGNEGTLWRYGRACQLIRQAGQSKDNSLDEARSLLIAIANRRSSWSRVPLCEGKIDDLCHNPQGAIKNYLRAIELGERAPDVIRRVAQLLYDQRRYAEADVIIQKLPDQVALPAEFQRLVSQVSLQVQDYERALKVAQQAVAAQSKDYRDHIWLAQVLWVMGQREQAESVLRHAVELAGDVPDTWVALILCLARSDQPGKAEAAIHQARAKLAPDKAPLALGQCYEALGRPAEAKKLYLAALQAKPDDLATLRVVSNFHLRSGAAEEAKEYLQKIVALQTKSPDEASWARRMLAIVMASQGEYQQRRQALALLGILDDGDHASPTNEERVEDLRTRALVLAVQKEGRQRRRAIAILEKLADRQAAQPDDLFLLAQMYDSVRDWPKARERMLHLLGIRADNPDYLAYYVRRLLDRREASEAELWLGRLEKLPAAKGSLAVAQGKARLLALRRKSAEAIAVVQAFIDDKESRPPERTARLEMAGALLDSLATPATGDSACTAAAEPVYRELAAARPEKVLALVDYLGRHGRVAEALDQCERAWRTNPPEGVAYSCMAVLHDKKARPEHYRRVESWLQDALAKKPNSALLACLADLRDLEGRYADAVAGYRQVLEADAHNPVALNNLAWLLSLGEGKSQEALELVNRAIELQGPLPELRDTRAVIYVQLGETRRAIQELQETTAEQDLANSWFHLAQAYTLVKDIRAAKEAFRRAKELQWSEDQLHRLEKPGYDKVLQAVSDG